MIVQGKTNTIERGGDVVESHFKIKATGKAFKILSDGLYSDKPLAIVRELSCNAYDAHVAAGKKDVPFTVHLPNHMEPFFSVKDEGVGLSREQVEQIFTTYFESTKSDSNDYIGALGLGSKSPFSYVDSFTVISRHNGMKYSFNAFLNEDEIPSIALLFEEETTEGNGVEITMPVRANDHHTFIEKATNILQWFDPLPKITGYPAEMFQSRLTKRDIILEGTNWKLQRTGYYDSYTRPFLAVQGRIAYPISQSAIEDHLTKPQRIVVRGAFVVDFNIGDLEVAASREHLSYKPSTIENIKKALDRIIAELPGKYQSSIDECKTLWDAKIRISELRENRLVSELLDAGGLSFTWGGKPLDARYLSIKNSELDGLTLTRYLHRSMRREEFKADQTGDFTLSASKRTHFFVNDLKRGGPSRVKKFNSETSNVDSTYMLSCEDEAVIERFFAALGDPVYRKVSELPAPEVRTRVLKSAIQIAEKSWNGVYHFVSMEDDIDLEDGGIYVPLLRGAPIQGEDVKIAEFSNLLLMAKNLKLLSDDEVVYGVTRAAIKEVAAHAEWTNVMTLLKERFEAWMQKNCLSDQIAFKQSYHEWYSPNIWKSSWLGYIPQFETQLGSQHALIQFKRMQDAAQSINVEHGTSMAALLGVEAVTSGGKAAFDFAGEWAKIQAKYQILELDPQIRDNKQMEKLVTYFKLVDQE